MQQYIKQYSNIPYEIFTIDNLYTESELNKFKKIVNNWDPSIRSFTNSEFKNGKLIMPEISSLMYSKIETFLPFKYIDRNNLNWTYKSSPHFIMYADVIENQQFSIHSDTGIIYDNKNNLYSKYTVLTYLNDDFEGGCTQFYDDKFNKTVCIIPKCNRTLIFDIDLFHAGLSVTKNNKQWIGTELVCTALLIP